MNKLYVIWGSSGHAKVLKSLIELEKDQIIAIFDNENIESISRNIPFYHGEDGFKKWLSKQQNTNLITGLVAIGGHRGEERLKIQKIFKSAGLLLNPLIHPKASICSTSEIGECSQVLAHAVIAADCKVGSSCIINHNSTLDHESKIGDGVHLAPGSIVCGLVSIGNNVMVGAGAIILEEYEHAKARGVKIYCELAGSGASADAYHLTAPHPEGLGVILVLNNALEDAGLQPTDVDYINVHGTSTPLGDVAELKAIQHVFGDHAYTMNISSTKSMTGHLLGAAGAIEAVATILSVYHDTVPPTINHFTDDENIDPKLNLTFNKAQFRPIRAALSNTFGFGGHNATVIFKKID